MKIADADLKKLLVDSGQVKVEMIDRALAGQTADKKPLQTLVIEQKLISEKALAELYAKFIGIPFVELSEKKIPHEILTKIPEPAARQHQVVLFGFENNLYELAMADPEDLQTLDFMSKQVGGTVTPYLALPTDIMTAIDQYKSSVSSKVTEPTKDSVVEKPTQSEVSTKNLAEDASIAKTVNVILEYGIKSGASDIHIEPRESFVQVRYRVDGVLRETMTLPRPILAGVISRIKTLANLKIDENRLPQDGRFKFAIGPKMVSLRVSCLPVMDGEKIVMRLIDESTRALTLQELGLGGYSLEAITASMHKSHGVILVTGPTGSGKSTTLYSLLSMLNKPGVNISTVEDPVEYRIAGVNQTQVNPQAGMTFASGLRALLRQDPNIVMVGELGDDETADLAVNTALTGRVVLSTLHTDNAAGSLPRLLDMGIEPFLIASIINTVIGQRLVRRLCQNCRVEFIPEGNELADIRRNFGLEEALTYFHGLGKVASPVAPQKPITPIAASAPGSVAHHKERIIEPTSNIDRQSILDRIAADPNIIDRSAGEAVQKTEQMVAPIAPVVVAADPGKLKPGQFMLYKAGPGCEQCGGAGYRGRIGIFEVLENDPTISKMIVGHATPDDIQAAAVEKGMLTMQQDGLVKALMGLTTIEEILRATSE